MIEHLEVEANQQITLSFESVDSPWRQGVFVATDGALEIAGQCAPTFVLWSDTAPNASLIRIVRTGGRLVFYNVWDSGRGRRLESQSATSGMIVETLADGTRRYRCNDIGAPSDFQRLVFRVGTAERVRLDGLP